MNPDQKRHLTTTLCMVEKNLAHKENLLRSQGEKGVLYEIVDTFHEEQRRELLARIEQLREHLAQVQDQFGLAVERTDIRSIFKGALNMLWVWLQESKTKKLRGYGTVDEGLDQDLDPLVEKMASLIDEVLKILAET